MTKRFQQNLSKTILFKNCWLTNKSTNQFSEDSPRIFNFHDSSRTVIVNTNTMAELKMSKEGFLLIFLVKLILLRYISTVGDQLLFFYRIPSFHRNCLQDYEACLFAFWVKYSTASSVSETVIREHLLIHFNKADSSNSKIFFFLPLPNLTFFCI